MRAIAFEADVDPDTVRISQRTDWHTTSGSLFRANIQALAGTFRLVRGNSAIYVKTAEPAGTGLLLASRIGTVFDATGKCPELCVTGRDNPAAGKDLSPVL